MSHNPDLVKALITGICQADVWCRGCRKALDCRKAVVITARNHSVAYCTQCFETLVKPNLSKLPTERREQLEFFHWPEES